MPLTAFLSRQLAKPSGLFGRLFTARWLNRANGEMNALTHAMLALGAHDRLLEIGFGGGDLLERIAAQRTCAFVAGLDVSPEMVARARRRLRRAIAGGRARIEHGSIEAMPFADGEFSRLCSVNTLYFWNDPQRALAECRRVLEPQARLVLCYNDARELAQWPGHAHGFTLHEVGAVEAMLAAAGFTALATRSASDAKQGLFHCTVGVAA